MTQAATVRPFQPPGKLSLEDYRARRAELRATYGDSKREAGALADQALARLFAQSNWTLDELAKEEGKTFQWVALHCRFGRFLEFSTAVENFKTLTEWRFRKYWERTDSSEKNERRRFQAVLTLMHDETTLSKSHKNHLAIGQAVRTTCGDGTWHRFTTIVSKTQGVEPEATADQVRAVLKSMIALGSYQVFCEKQKGGDLYRIVRGGGRKIDVTTLRHEVDPIIKALKAEGRKNMATMSPGTVSHLASQLEKLLDRLAHDDNQEE